MEQAAREGKAVHEGWRLRKDGTAFWGSILITALHGPDGEVVGFSKVTRDITERKQAEDKLLQYARQLEAQNKELQQFAYAAAHDMKEPLRKIRYYYSAVRGLTEEDLTGELRDKYLERSAQAAERMQQLIDDLLLFTRIAGQPSEAASVDLNEVLNEAVESLQDTLDGLGGVVTVGSLSVVGGIKFQLRQLFINLLGNSIKYRRLDRSLRVAVSAAAVDIPTMADAYGASEFCRIDVVDNGIGFDDAYADKIFGMFERLHGRAKYPGSGIGLAICRRIMENNGGFIRATGAPDEGAVFSCFFRKGEPMPVGPARRTADQASAEDH